MKETAHVMLLDTLARLDDLRKIDEELPPDDVNLLIDPDIEKLPAISTAEWKVLALVNGRRTIKRIYQMHGDELTAKKMLLSLFKKGVLSGEPPESDWRRLVPAKKPTAEVEGERPVPPRLRTNLVLRTINGELHLEDISRALDISETDLLEDMKLLHELQWVKFSNGKEEQTFLALIKDI